MFAFLGKWQTPSIIARKALKAKAKNILAHNVQNWPRLCCSLHVFCPQFVVWKWMGWRNCEKKSAPFISFCECDCAYCTHAHTQIYCSKDSFFITIVGCWAIVMVCVKKLKCIDSKLQRLDGSELWQALYL